MRSHFSKKRFRNLISNPTSNLGGGHMKQIDIKRHNKTMRVEKKRLKRLLKRLKSIC